jgi:hypothetical protein
MSRGVIGCKGGRERNGEGFCIIVEKEVRPRVLEWEWGSALSFSVPSLYRRSAEAMKDGWDEKS